MPRIKRWFPVSHDFNRDPEVIELRQTFGDWMAFVWQEMLSISDRNEGKIRGSPDFIAASFTWLWNTNSKRYNTEWKRNKIRMAFEWMSNKHWIGIESDSIRILNHLEYHRSEVRKHVPPRPDPTGPTPISPSGNGGKLQGFEEFWKQYPKKIGKGAAEKAWQKIHPTNGTVQSILTSIAEQKNGAAWAKDGGQFIPHPSTWLNQKRWEDEIDLIPDPPKFTPIPIVRRIGELVELADGTTMKESNYERRFGVKPQGAELRQ